MFCIFQSYQRLGAILWIGAHLFIFCASVLLFLFLIFIQTSQQRQSLSIDNGGADFESSFFQNTIGYVFSAVLVFNAMFLLTNTIFAVQLLISRPVQRYALVNS